jgi:hypothetical protein
VHYYLLLLVKLLLQSSDDHNLLQEFVRFISSSSSLHFINMPTTTPIIRAFVVARES